MVLDRYLLVCVTYEWLGLAAQSEPTNLQRGDHTADFDLVVPLAAPYSDVDFPRLETQVRTINL